MVTSFQAGRELRRAENPVGVKKRSGTRNDDGDPVKAAALTYADHGQMMHEA